MALEVKHAYFALQKRRHNPPASIRMVFKSAMPLAQGGIARDGVWPGLSSQGSRQVGEHNTGHLKQNSY